MTNKESNIIKDSCYSQEQGSKLATSTQNEPISSNKRIAKNAIMLYIRMFFSTIVSLYTSRVVLNTLGVEDFGIYNVVGCFVSMFSLISSSISSSISRFITYEIGTGNIEQLKKIFSTSITILIIISILICVIAEILGLWFLNNKLEIASDRMLAAQWVFHCSLISLVVSLISLPYNACIIAHEKMGAFACISIIEVFLKLIFVYLLLISPFDKLITYAIIGVIIAIIIRFVYVWYCTKNFVECNNYEFVLDRSLFKQMFSFASWELVGCSAGVLREQGGNILMNLFTKSTVVNAASGIASTIIGLVSSFVNNFTTAFTPQIIKLYAAKKFNELINLVYMGSKFAPFLMLLLALPIFFNARFILELWLGIVPEHTVNFVLITILFMFNEIISRPLITAKLATGAIKNYELIVGGVLLLTLPIAYVALMLGAPVEAVFLAKVLTSVIATFVRLYMLREDIPCLSISDFIKNVYFRVIYVGIVAAILPTISYMYISNQVLQFVITSIIAIISTIISVYFIGCTKNEQTQIRNYVSKFKTRIFSL